MSDRDVMRALRTSVAGDPAAAAEAVRRVAADGGVGRLLDAARRHRVVDAVAPLLRDVPEVDPGTLEDLHRRAISKAAHQLRVLDDLRWFARCMEDASVPWLAFKGPVISALLYDPPGARGYQDLDLSIRREDFPRAIESLEEAGAHLLDANWTLIRREGRGQLHLVLPLGTVADVHWHLLNRRSVRDSFEIPMGELIARARTVELEGLTVRTLDPVDTLLHLCLHAALAGADRLCWLDDVRRSIVIERPSWEEVVRRGRAWRSGAPVAVSLRRARIVLSAPVPEAVIRSLDPSLLRRAIGGWVDRRWSAESPHHRFGLSALWPQLVRDDPWATAGTVLHRASRPLVSGLHRLRGVRASERAAQEGDVFRPSGTPDERRRFMHAVSAGDLSRRSRGAR